MKFNRNAVVQAGIDESLVACWKSIRRRGLEVVFLAPDATVRQSRDFLYTLVTCSTYHSSLEVESYLSKGFFSEGFAPKQQKITRSLSL